MTFTQEELRAISEEIAQALPAEAPTERMLALVDIDPYHVQVYWQVPRADLKAAQGCTGIEKDTGDALVLRVHDALCMTMHGFIPWPPLEIEVDGLNGNRHVEVPDSGHALIAELGLRGADGEFVPLAWSRPVRLPRTDEAEIPRAVDLVVVDEPGSPPRVVEVPSQAPGDEPEDPWHALPLDRVGADGVYEGPISSRDLAKGMWSGDLPSMNSDGDQA